MRYLVSSILMIVFLTACGNEDDSETCSVELTSKEGGLSTNSKTVSDDSCDAVCIELQKTYCDRQSPDYEYKHRCFNNSGTISESFAFKKCSEVLPM